MYDLGKSVRFEVQQKQKKTFVQFDSANKMHKSIQASKSSRRIIERKNKVPVHLTAVLLYSQKKYFPYIFLSLFTIPIFWRTKTKWNRRTHSLRKTCAKLLSMLRSLSKTRKKYSKRLIKSSNSKNKRSNARNEVVPSSEAVESQPNQKPDIRSEHWISTDDTKIPERKNQSCDSPPRELMKQCPRKFFANEIQ